MLIAHVESLGVWRIDGGMRALAAALVRCAESMGVEFEYDVDVNSIIVERGCARGITSHCGLRETADAVVLNADTNAIAAGKFGAAVQHAVAGTDARQRSLSAVTFAGSFSPVSRELQYHNVFFSNDYRREFAALASDSKMPVEPTTYLCAPGYTASSEQPLFVLVNAPANGDSVNYDTHMVERIRVATSKQLEACGLPVDLDDFEVTTPNDFAARYPGTGGALYGPAMHGWRAAFRRSGNATRIPGLFVAGGSVHPGSGVPMAATSGKLCAAEVLANYEHRRKHLSRLSASRQNHAAG
jgi:1-hydroxycarotenoid 3,4-desaturase